MTTGLLGVEQSNPRPTPNLEDQSSVFVTSGDRVTQVYLQALGTHLVAFNDTHELRWDYPYPPVTTRSAMVIYSNEF
jgi:hypothetical protein